MQKHDYIKGISIINPDEVERDYLMFCMEYAVKNGFNHVQITGPIHDHVKGNIDGMTLNRKYAQFNYEKDLSYVKMCEEVVNEALEYSSKNGVKTFMWHHELDLPKDFGKEFPEVLNQNGDVEVTHPLIKDYLENKIKDFFFSYPKMDGIVLTLHETKIPLLKLKNQKLGKIERVKYVVEILFNVCESLGKEIVVRPFASLAEDQSLMLKAFEEISPNLIIMDKWTKFDWSLSLPDNDFFADIKNPFIVEGDVFGEYFGKGRLPIMFREHIEHKYSHCNQYPNSGFVARIDRNYQNPFGSVNEVNLVVNHAVINNLNVEEKVKEFFDNKYGKAGDKVRSIMEKTEANQKKIFYLEGYYFTQGSYFPEVNHAKNHFFFEIMRDDYCIASNEWFIPVGWKRSSIQNILEEKNQAVVEAQKILDDVVKLQGEIDQVEYDKLYLKFKNLAYVSQIWCHMAYSFYHYVKFFETKNPDHERTLFERLDAIDKLHDEGRKEFKEDFYNFLGARGFTGKIPEFNGDFTSCMKASFKYEKKEFLKLEKENLTDFIVCGGAFEGHKLQKEVNFSDTFWVGDEVCRIPGNKASNWSNINAHGWFSFELKVKNNQENTIVLTVGSSTDILNIQLSLGDQVHTFKENICGKKEIAINYLTKDCDSVRLRVDRVDANTPFVYNIKVK